MLFTEKIRKSLFVVFSILTVLIAVYHFLAIFTRFDDSPVWRHSLFVGINLFCAYGFLKRPKYFVYFTAMLLVQQYYSHGIYLVRLWIDKNQLHWLSVFVLILLPIALICLIDDYKMKKAGNRFR